MSRPYAGDFASAVIEHRGVKPLLLCRRYL